jgi:hypothetical protein
VSRFSTSRSDSVKESQLQRQPIRAPFRFRHAGRQPARLAAHQVNVTTDGDLPQQGVQPFFRPSRPPAVEHVEDVLAKSSDGLAARRPVIAEEMRQLVRQREGALVRLVSCVHEEIGRVVLGHQAAAQGPILFGAGPRAAMPCEIALDCRNAEIGYFLDRQIEGRSQDGGPKRPRKRFAHARFEPEGGGQVGDPQRHVHGFRTPPSSVG